MSVPSVPCPVSFCFIREGSLDSIFPPQSWAFTGTEAGGWDGWSRESGLEKAKVAGPESFWGSQAVTSKCRPSSRITWMACTLICLDIWVLLEFLPQDVWDRGNWCAGNFATSFAEEKEEEGGGGESPLCGICWFPGVSILTAANFNYPCDVTEQSWEEMCPLSSCELVRASSRIPWGQGQPGICMFIRFSWMILTQWTLYEAFQEEQK